MQTTTYLTRIVPVVGVTFVPGYPHTLHRLAAIHDDLTRGEPLAVILRRNPDNPHDANAVEIHVPALGDLAMIGHVSRAVASRLAPVIDAGTRLQAWVNDVRINPKHLDRPGIDISITRLPDVGEF